MTIFEQLRLQAMLMPPTAALREEVHDEKWSDFGRAIHENLMDPRFADAVLAAIAAYDQKSKETPQEQMVRRLRLYLQTGTIA